MDTLAKLIICVVLGAFYSPAQAATYAPSWGELKVIDGDLHMTRGNGTTSIMYPDAGLSKEIPVNTSKGSFLVPIEKTFPVEPSKLGKAATRFLKTLPAIGTAIALYDTVCDLTDICRNPQSGDLEYAPGIPNGYPVTTDTGYYRHPYYISTHAPTAELLCESSTYKSLVSSSPSYLSYLRVDPKPDTDNAYYCVYWSTSSSPAKELKTSIEYYANGGNCYTGYTKVGGQCVHNNAPVPVTETHWSQAETKLNAQPQQTATALYDSDAPVPVNGSTQSSPVTKQISQTSTQTKDELGNVTGTQVETKTVKVEDTSTATEVTYNITEITTITNYNENNQVTGTQTSTTDTEQPKAAEDTDISFDNVSDAQLDTEEIDVQLETPVSWGEGTCPPDETLTLQGRSYSISYEPACDAAADLRPIFVLLASVTALFIVAGVSRSRGE